MELKPGTMTRAIRAILREAGPSGFTLDQIGARLATVIPPENIVLEVRRQRQTRTVDYEAITIGARAIACKYLTGKGTAGVETVHDPETGKITYRLRGATND